MHDPTPVLEGARQPPGLATHHGGGGSSGALSQAVAAIVGIAAQRAAATGDLPRLRELLERVLDAAEPLSVTPDTTGLPDIADADPVAERRRLAALMRRQRR